jgi:hypothetical protein
MPDAFLPEITLNSLPVANCYRRWKSGVRSLRFTIFRFLTVGIVSSGVATAQQTAYSHGDPSALEQQMMELINRARMNPTQEGIILDSLNTPYSLDARTRKPSFFTNLRGEFASYPAVPPLAFNPKLIQAARAHS